MLLLHTTTLINRKFIVPLLAIFGISCTLDPTEIATPRSRLGEIKMAVVATYRNTEGVLEMEFRGKVMNRLRLAEGPFTLPNVGTFDRRIILKDTLSAQRDSVTIFYSLPFAMTPGIDSTMTTLVFYFKRTAAGSGFILKTKSDTLVCSVSTFEGEELLSFESRGGVQNFHATSGTNAYVTRPTECGREADYNMIFSVNGSFSDVPPAKTATLKSGRHTYAVHNVVNTQIIKNVKDCANYKGESAYIILRQ